MTGTPSMVLLEADMQGPTGRRRLERGSAIEGSARDAYGREFCEKRPRDVRERRAELRG